MTSVSSQLSLSLRDARWRPVLDVNGAKAALDIEAEEIEEFLDRGLLIGFDIAVTAGFNGDRLRRRELRVLTESVCQYRATLGSRPFRIGWPGLFRLLVTHEKPAIDGTEIQRALNATDEHVTNLIRAGRLRVVDGTTFGRGRNRTPCVTRESFEHFLREREHCRQFLNVGQASRLSPS